MSFQPRPHTSAALEHLRFSITVLSCIVSVCLLLQVLVWAFVHYTDVQWIAPEIKGAAQRHVVVGSESESALGSLVVDGGADVNRVEGRNGVLMRHGAAVVQTIGIISVTVLSLLMLQSVVIAGGGNVPGVERVVTASTWMLIFAGLSLPLGRLLPESPYDGVFLSYATLTHDAALMRGEASGEAPPVPVYYTTRLLLPLLLMVGVLLALLRHRSGVEAGIIVTNVSQLDEKLEREIRGMKLGQLASPRAVGALNAAIGEREPLPLHPPGGASAVSGTGTDGAAKGMGRPI